MTQASLGSPVALHTLLTLSVAGVVDASFVTQTDGSENVYLVSSLAPPSGQNPGTPTAAQNAAALALVNNGRSRHVGRPYSVENPTATLYSVVMTAYYDATVTPDLAALQTAVGDALKAFVIASRRLGVSIARSNLEGAAKVEGVSYVSGAMYTDDITMSSPMALDLLDPTDDSIFYTCADEVNNVADLASGTNGEINLIWSALS